MDDRTGLRRNTLRRSGAGRLAAGLALALALGGALPGPAQRDVRLPGLRGGALTSADLGKGATVLVVWASWSPRCRDIVERVNALAASWGGKARVATVNFQEDPATIEAFLGGRSLSVPVYLDRDGEFSKAHAVTTLPGLVVFRDGAVRYQGKLPPDADGAVRDALN